MTSKTFVDFNLPVIDAAWLNDVNSVVYGPTSPAGTFRGDLAASTGSSLVGHIAEGVGAGLMTLQTAVRDAAVTTLEQYLGVGDNVNDDLPAMQKAAAFLTLKGGGTIKLKPGRTYYMNTDAMAGTVVCSFTNLTGVVIDGQGATIRTGTTNKLLQFFNVTDTNGFTLKDLNLSSGYTTLDSLVGVEWTKFNGSCRNVVLMNGSMTYGRTGIQCLGTIGTPAVTTKNIVALNWTFTQVYYAQIFNASGSGYFARGIVTLGCGRSYFPIAPVSGHDIVMESQQGGPFDDCLFKVYSSTLDAVKLSDIKLRYKSPGRYPGAGAESTSDAAVFAFDFQQLEAGTSAGSMNDISIICDLDFSVVDTTNKVMSVRKVPFGGGYDSVTRGHKFENITLSGKIRNTQRLTDVTIDMFSVVGGMNWTGETGQNITLKDLIMEGSNVGRTDVRYNGQVNTGTGQNFRMDGVRAPGLYTPTNVTLGNISTQNSRFAGLSRENGEGDWTPTATPSVSGTITLSTATGSYTKVGRQVTATALLIVGSVSTPVGSLQIGGLPFANATGNKSYATFAVFGNSLAATATTVLVGQLAPGNIVAEVFKYAAGAASNLAGDVQAGSTFILTVTYFVA